MRRIRVIPVLLLQKGGLVKSVKFRDTTYVGDPINAVKIFNEKEIDEIVILDIDATVNAYLEVDCRLVIPTEISVNLSITSTDVIHS